MMWNELVIYDFDGVFRCSGTFKISPLCLLMAVVLKWRPFYLSKISK